MSNEKEKKDIEKIISENLEKYANVFIGSENSSLLLPITEKQYAAMTENK